MTAAGGGRYADQVMALRSVDDHGHPLPSGTEAINLESPINPYDGALGFRMRPTNPEYVEAWRALWGYEHADFDPAHLGGLIELKLAAQKRPDYYEWMLDRLNCDAMLYIAMAPIQTFPASRFHWCAHVDWILWPFVNPEEKDRVFVPGFLEANREHCAEAGFEGLPDTLAAYVAEIVEGSMARFRASGAIAIKFNTAYYRPILFDPVPDDDASAIYRRARSGFAVTAREHTTLQDYFFRSIVSAAGDARLPVQIHTGLGARPHFQISHSNPLLLESVFRDAPHTDFLLLHGGWPFDREAVSALAHENVYLDFSCANLYFYPRQLANLIRSALEWFPEKLVYGTDNHSDRSIAKLSGVPPRANPLAGWEEKFWLVDRTSRQALAMALEEMAADGHITPDGGLGLARAVLRENARALYSLAPDGRK